MEKEKEPSMIDQKKNMIWVQAAQPMVQFLLSESGVLFSVSLLSSQLAELSDEATE
jgi:hypothetical protein